MNCNLFRILSFFSIVICFHPLSAQQIDVTGQVVEARSNKPIEFATVTLSATDSQQPITGSTTDLDGGFLIQTDQSEFVVEVSFVGFNTHTIDDISIVNGKVDLGKLVLVQTSEALDEIVVRAERSQTEFKLDKRVFNVGKDLSSAGASALDVLNNVPSVNVNIEGEISLRGSTGVQILVNGKPSVIANEQGNVLGTITADMIEQIEVITNPSAKYDAEGTSGIINIVIKKEERKGMNGSLSVNAGTPNNYSVGLSLNRRTEKFNLFSQLGVGYRELPNDIEVVNSDLINNTTISTVGKEFRNEKYYNVILGTDYHIDKNNVLTLSGNFAYEIEDQPSQTDFQFIDENGLETAEWRRDEVTEATNPKFQYELQYKRDFEDDEDHTLLFSALGSFFGKDQSSDFTNSTISGINNDGKQQTRTEFKEAKYTFKLDYNKPYSNQFTLETGAQYVLTDVSNDYSVSDWEDNMWLVNYNLTNVFEYDQKVLGAYGTGAYENDLWGLKLGLRLENTNLNTLLANTGEANVQNYTNLFPSAHTSYKFTEGFSAQAGYSRRIFRPRLWDLNPFFNIRNNFNIRVGNPDLLPQFTDSYEVTGILIVGKTSMNLGAYYRYTTDVVERISSFEDGVNTTMPINLGINRATGIEFNGKYRPNNKVTINGDFNFNTFTREGSLEEKSFDFSSNQWNSKLMTKVKLPLDIEIEITGHYNSGYESVQGSVSGNVFMDFGLRKKIMDGKGVLNISGRDLFASRFRESFVTQPGFELYSRRQRGRFVTFGFSYGFGKGEAMEYSGQRRRR